MRAVALSGLILACLSFAKGPQQILGQDFVLTDARAFAILPPEPVPVSGVTLIDWSPTGRFLVMLQEVPKINPAQVVEELLGKGRPKQETHLVAWDRTTSRFRDFGPAKRFIGELAYEEGGAPWGWFTDTDVMYVSIGPERGFPVTAPDGGEPVRLRKREETTFRIFNLMTGNLSDPALVGKGEGVDWDVEHEKSPSTSTLLFLQTCMLSDDPARLEVYSNFRLYGWTMRPDGSVTAPVFLGEGPAVYLEGWAGDGSIAKLSVPASERTVPPKKTIVYFDVKQGNLVATGVDPAPHIETADAPPIVITAKPEKNLGPSRFSYTHSVDARKVSEFPSVVLSRDADEASLSPKLDAVAILERGVVTIRHIATINRQAWDEVLRQEVTRAAKQTALSMMMYAADYDDLLPGQEHFGDGAVDPYTREPSWLKKFTFKLGGTNLGKLQNPAAAMLGYIPGPGGYAIAFADGHVEWRTRLP